MSHQSKNKKIYTIFPEKADNNYSFPQFIVAVFFVITIMTIGRSLAHIFLPDGGANYIAGIVKFDGTPDPDRIIYFLFALWGLAQLSMGIMYLVVLVRYRNLIPLMWVFIFIEYSMRVIIGKLLKPLDIEYITATAPGEIGNYVLIPLALTMIILSFRGKN